MSVNRSLEDRIRAIEDRLEIYNLIASHPPSADTAGNDHIAASWVEDGVFDRGENLSSPRGRESIANQVLSLDHQAAIERGLAHFTSLPHVEIEGDAATVTSYLQILVPQTQGDPVDVPNHGSSKGFRVHRMTANRWELVRTPQGWKIKRCVSSTARSRRGKSCGRRSRGERCIHCGRSALSRSSAPSSIQIGRGRPTPAAIAR
ncbi:MAG: nuclear transport factor 2 family protein [Hyphomicrobiales bacterium]|nr:nuclear transport factor 2 family protein [Hyphomicrobiales bacterium]